MTQEIRYVPNDFAFKGNNFPTMTSTEFLTRLQNKLPTYEVMPKNDEKIKMFFDFDYGSIKKEDFNLDVAQEINRILKDRITKSLFSLTEIQPTFHIMESHTNNYDENHGKYSFRYFISNIIASRHTIKNFTIDMNKYFDTAETELWDYIEKDGDTFDLQVYTKERKMRCYETSKPNQNRPLKLIEGNIEGTIIQAFMDKDVFEFNYESKIRPSSPNSVVPNCENNTQIKADKYIELLTIIGKGNEKILHNIWFNIGSILKTNGYTKKVFEEFTKEFVANKEKELDKIWDCINTEQIYSVHGLQKLAKRVNLSHYNEWFIKHKQYISLKTITKGNNDIASFISKGLKEVLVYCNKQWIMYDNRINLWRITDAPNAKVCNYIQHLIDCSLETLIYKMNRIENEDEKKPLKIIQVAYNNSRAAMADNKENSMILKLLKDYLNDNEFFSKLDINKHNVAYKNGMLDLKTLKFREGLLPSDMLTQTIPYNYEKAEQKTIDKVRLELRKICNNNETHLEYYLSALGYAMTGDSMKLQEFYYIIGQKASNGKSVIFEALNDIIPCYCKKIESNAFEEKNSGFHKEVATWKGIRIGWINELTSNKQDAEILKQVADGTSIKYKVMYGISDNMLITFKNFIISNHSPNIDADEGIKRRLRMWQMDSEFIEGLEVEDYEKCLFKRDANFAELLRTTYKFALMDLIYSYSNKVINNSYKLSQYPNEWNEIKQECIIDNNPFAEFIMEHFEFNQDYTITEYELKQIFKVHKINVKFNDQVKRNRWNIHRKPDKKWYGFRQKSN